MKLVPPEHMLKHRNGQLVQLVEQGTGHFFSLVHSKNYPKTEPVRPDQNRPV